MRVAIALVLSVLTLVGGHIYNRRLDRAGLFLALTVLGIVMAWMLPAWLADPYELDPMDAIPPILIVSMLTSLIPVLAWAVSIVVAGVDALRHAESVSRAGPVSAVFMMLAGLVIVGLQGTTVQSFAESVYLWSSPDVQLLSADSEPLGDHVKDTLAPEWGRGDTFPGYRTYADWGRVSPSTVVGRYVDYLGDSGKVEWSQGPASTGDGVLLGHIKDDDGQPASLLVSLNIADLGTTEPVSVEASGRFIIPVPPGTWTINGVKVITDGRTYSDWWIRTGAEPPLDAAVSYMSETRNAKGPSVSIGTKAPDEPHITLDLKRRIDLQVEGVDFDATPPRAGDSARLEWQPQSGAVRYQVVFWDYERRPNGGSVSSPVRGIIVDGSTSLALSTLPLVPAKSASSNPPEYRVEIFGFDDRGRLVAQGHDGRSFDSLEPFQLPDGKALPAVHGVQEIGTEADLTALLADLDAQKKLDAVEVLLDEELPNEAGKLLERIDPDQFPARWLRLESYRAALTGDCEAAHAAFERAKSIDDKGCDCRKDAYFGLCRRPEE